MNKSEYLSGFGIPGIDEHKGSVFVHQNEAPALFYRNGAMRIVTENTVKHQNNTSLFTGSGKSF